VDRGRVRDRYGELNDQLNTKWIVIKGPLRGHNDVPCGQPTPGRSIGCLGRPVREEVSTDSLKFHAGPPCPTLIRPQGGRPAAVLFPLGYPMPYGPAIVQNVRLIIELSIRAKRRATSAALWTSRRRERRKFSLTSGKGGFQHLEDLSDRKFRTIW
jgi:hypothetical protein